MLRSAILVVACGVPLTAQYTQSMTLDTDAGQLASAAGQSQFRSAAKGTIIPPIRSTWRLRAEVASGSGASARSAAQSIWASAELTNGGGMGLSGLARGSAADTAFTTPSRTAGGRPGAIAFLSQMTGPRNLRGRIRLSWQTLFRPGATGGASLDVGNDGSIDWTGTATSGSVRTIELPTTFDAAGKLNLRFTLGGSIAGRSPFTATTTYARLTWKFIEPSTARCTVTPFLTGCKGAASTGLVRSAPEHFDVTLTTTGGAPNAFAMEVLSTRRQYLPLPGGCNFLVTPEVTFLRRTDARGTSSSSYRISKYGWANVYHQVLPFTTSGGQLDIRSSNGLEIRCRAAR